MHVLITDSGVGGLSVCAYAERFVRLIGYSEAVRLTFANAAPENDYGYNSMPTREEKLETFDRFLRNVSERYRPDFIYVACNTLSVLMPDTPFVTAGSVPVKGIVETGVEVLLRELDRDPRRAAIIFATQTTVDAGTYPRLLVERGIEPSRIISQACPRLADVISEDREGDVTRAEIGKWVAAAVEKLHDKSAPVVASLNCTHYGYRKNEFAAALSDQQVRAVVINPNEQAVGDILPQAAKADHRDAEVKFVTRYAIPETAQAALSFFLGQISPATVEAMNAYEHVPDLF